MAYTDIPLNTPYCASNTAINNCCIDNVLLKNTNTSLGPYFNSAVGFEKRRFDE